MTARAVPAAVLLVGSLGVIAGSVDTWGTCDDSSCGHGGLQVMMEMSGFDLGPGLLTLGLGLVLAVVAVDALRRGGMSPRWWVATVAALAVLGIVTAFVLRMFVLPDALQVFPDTFLLGPGSGVVLVYFGAALSVVASIGLRSRAAREA